MRVPWKLALRDVALLLATLALWRLEAGLRGSGEGGAVALALLTGALTGLCGYLAHEWGHLAAAWLSGSVVHLPRTVFVGFLFNYDADRNRREQFLAMSCGGFLASGLVVALFLVVLPRDALAGQVALGITLLGVLATVVLEFPPAWKVLRGGPLPRGVAYHSERAA